MSIKKLALLGAITLVKGGASRAYGPEDQAMLQNLADRVALALANARLFAENLRQACKPQLENIGPALDTLIVPPDIQGPVRAMSEAAANLRTATSGFIIYLDDPELDYDETAARPHVQAMVRAWYEFKKAHNEANQVIKAQREQ